MAETKRQLAAQVAPARKAAALKKENHKPQHRPPARASSISELKPATARLQDNSRTERSDGEFDDDSGEPDTLVPDRIVAKELGTTVMTVWRRTNDPQDGFPAPVKIRGRNFRSRRQLEAYKNRKLREAMRIHHDRLNVRRREPLTEPEPQ